MNLSLVMTVVRVIFYILSPVLAMVPAWLGGAIVPNPAAGTVTIDFEALVTALIAALGVSGGIFAKWGKK